MPIPFADHPGIIRLDGYVSGIRLGGQLQSATQLFRVDPNQLSYDMMSLTSGHPGPWPNLTPRARVTISALVNSAVLFQPCSLVLSPFNQPVFSVIEEIVFENCPPGVPTNA